MVEFLGVVELGTLYKKGVELSLPTRPWKTDDYPSSLSLRGRGNIPRDTGSMSYFKIGDTSSKVENRLKWIKIKDENKNLLICDRNILNSMTWKNLDSERYIFGKEIIIDGIECKCRVLTSYEWNKYIENRYNISGLPKPTSIDLDGKLTYENLDGAHNQLWHWWYNCSWCQDTTTYMRQRRAIARGNNSAIGSSELGTDTYYEYYQGWRPVLEVPKSEKYLLKQDNKYFSINPEFYDITAGQYKPVDKNFKDNGFHNIEDLAKEINGFKPIDKFKGKIEILKQEEEIRISSK